MTIKHNVLSVTTNISRYGGAQKVMLDVHKGLKNHIDSKILSLQPLTEIHAKYNLSDNELVRFVNPWVLNNKILIVHARNLIPFFVWLKRLFFLNVRIIYVSHNVYDNLRGFTFFPNEVISISEKVTHNLLTYFKVPARNISLIYNGMEDFGISDSDYEYKKDGRVKILYPARINKVKRQLEIVEALRKGGLSNQIEIHFAGVGDDYEELKRKCDEQNFKALGFVENVHALIPNYDYLMLFSIQEGLPLGLIEGAMHSKPMLVNDVGGNLEIAVPSQNGILLKDDFESLANQLNNLLQVSEEEYHAMAQRSRAIYLERFGYKKMIDNYLNMILKPKE